MGKLVPEQLPFLFVKSDEMKWELFDKMMNQGIAEDYATQRIDGIGNVPIDYTANKGHLLEEMKKIRSILENSEIIMDRNLERIDVGTAFYGRFLKDEEGKFEYDVDRFIMVDSHCGTDHLEDNQFISKESLLGKAVLGKKDDDVVMYDVEDENGKKESRVFYIDSIDRNRDHYMGFVNSNKRAK